MKTKNILICGIFAVLIALAFTACPPEPNPTVTLSGITLNTTSVKKAYNQNETLNLSGLVVTANYSDSTSAAVTDYTASPANGAVLSTSGTTTVTISYTEGIITKTASFDVTVADPDPAHVHDYQWTVTTAPTETTNGVETYQCTIDPSHTNGTRTLYATGTEGLAFDLISGGDNDGTYRVHNGGNRNFAVIHIPAYWRGTSTDYADYKPVTEIGNGTNTYNNNAFGGTDGADNANTSLTAVHIPATVTTISEAAFENCTVLTSVTLGNNVSIGDRAFPINSTGTGGNTLRTAYLNASTGDAGTYTRSGSSTYTWTKQTP